MAFGQVTPERSHTENAGPGGGSPDSQQQQQAAAAAETKQKVPSPSRGLTMLKYEFTKRRTIVFGVGMGLLLYVTGAMLLFIAIRFDLQDFLVMGSGSLIVGTIFVLAIVIMKCRDSFLKKKALKPGEALVRTDDGFTRYSLAGDHRKSVVPATRIGSATDSERTKSASPLRNAVIPERGESSRSPPVDRGLQLARQHEAASSAGSEGVPPPSRYGRSSSVTSLVEPEDFSLNRYNSVSDDVEPGSPPVVTLPRAVSALSTARKLKKEASLVDSVYSEPLPRDARDEQVPGKTTRTSSLASTGKNRLVSPSGVEATTAPPLEASQVDSVGVQPSQEEDKDEDEDEDEDEDSSARHSQV